jgi:hypothetical protein
MMSPEEMKAKRKADEMRMMSSAEVMAAVKRVTELEAPHTRLEGRNREVEGKVGALETLLSAIMSINRELKVKVDEMSIELEVAKKAEAKLAVVVAEMGALISHFGIVISYAHTGEGTPNMHLHLYISIT